MKIPSLLFLAIVAFFTASAFADTVILRDGSSHNGESSIQTVDFTDLQGVKYQFPLKDIQSLAFNPTQDTITLRRGISYTGHFTGNSSIGFEDSQGIKYQFPTSDIDAIVFNRAGLPSTPIVTGDLVIAIGTDLPVRIDETIDSTNSYQGQTYSATITEDILDTAGHLAIPAGSRARLMIRDVSTGGAVHSAELVLDLYSIDVHGKQYRVASSNLDESNRKGLGANRRTAEFLGGGTALGALLGGVFGGGRGAGIGALAGAGGGFVTQAFTRGKKVQVPAESVLRFRLEKTLVLHGV
jgi:hypothetical protein